jgi:pimeloyl-ACP methyl ester carboxylesterase
VIDHDGEVVTATLVGDLVDPDPGQPVQAVTERVDVGPDPGNDRPDRAPRNPRINAVTAVFEPCSSAASDRPAQPVDAFLAQIDAVIAHDASGALNEIDVPTLITFGARDIVCSTRFAQPLKNGITRSELVVFDHLSHAGLHEDPATFNRATLDFLLRQRA